MVREIIHTAFETNVLGEIRAQTRGIANQDRRVKKAMDVLEEAVGKAKQTEIETFIGAYGYQKTANATWPFPGATHIAQSLMSDIYVHVCEPGLRQTEFDTE